MKKLCIVAVAALGFTFGAQAQEGFNLGGFIGVTTGDVSDVYGLDFGVDANYMFDVSDQFQVGPALGYYHSLPKSDFKDVIDAAQFLPIAASGKFMAAEDFSIGADLGYALGLDDGNDGGFYYRPKVGYTIADGMDLQLSYTGVSMDGGSWSSVNLGVMFQL
tara:strand:+ start:24152 stop:24637 length:486 start_codon:yes stop_codon:yes gene_type:complete